MNTVDRAELLNSLQSLLEPHRYKDYCPNGLQVEGRQTIRKIVTGVTASLALIEAAVQAGADALLVHHGLFWRGDDGCVTGWKRRRLEVLLKHNVNVFAYHLPLDAHPLLGNNACLGQLLGFQPSGTFGDQQLGVIGAPINASFEDAHALAKHIETTLGHGVVCVSASTKPIRKVAWCSGGAQSYFEAAIAQGADAFITGEISEAQVHYARECGVAFLACGHHATERYGVQAVGTELAKQWGIIHEFIDIDSPA